MIEASVIVPAHDAAQTLARALDALAAQAPDGRHEVIVVDDASTDGTGALAEAHPTAPRVVRRERPGGPGAARNDGAAAARAPVLAFLDADCFPTPGWLAAGLRSLASADLVQGAVLPLQGTPMGPWDRSLAVTRDWGLFETANLFMARNLFERIGGFEPVVTAAEAGHRPMGGAVSFGEDVWLGWRARRAGARTAFCSDALAYHAIFPGTARAHVAERARERYFPPLARAIPELRREFLYRRVFLSPRAATFDAAVVAAALAAARRSPAPLLAALPYARALGREARRWGRRRAPMVAAVEAAGDAVGLVARVRGSIAARSLVL